MTLCPVAIIASCKQCPMFKICPGKGIIGDHRKGASSSDTKEVSRKTE